MVTITQEERVRRRYLADLRRAEKAEIRKQQKLHNLAVKREQLAYDKSVRKEAIKLSKKKSRGSRKTKRMLRKAWRRLI